MSLAARLAAAAAAIPASPDPPARRDAAAFRAEADRRRRLALSLSDPRLFDVRRQLQELDAFHDAWLGAWLFPDRRAVAAALALIGGPRTRAAPVPLRELRTRAPIEVGRVYTVPSHRVAEGWPARVRVERLREFTLPDGAVLRIAAVAPAPDPLPAADPPR